MNKILYATDLPENAKKAFGHAAKLEQHHHADLIMLHVFDIPASFDFPYIDDAREMKRQVIDLKMEEVARMSTACCEKYVSN